MATTAPPDPSITEITPPPNPAVVAALNAVLQAITTYAARAGTQGTGADLEHACTAYAVLKGSV